MTVALAAFAAAGASGTELSTKAHRRTPVRASARATRHRPVSRAAHHSAARAASSSRDHRAPESARRTYGRRDAELARRKRTPEEVGEAAGLAILEGRAESRSYSAYRRRRSRPAVESAIMRSSRRRLRAYPEQHVEEAAFISPPRAAAVERASRTETFREGSAASIAARDEGARGVERATRENAPEEAPKASESDVAASAATGSALRQKVQPEPDAETPMPQDAGGLQAGADAAENAADDATQANSAEESEDASLVVPRGAMPAPLLGSLASLERQNERLEAEGLQRIENESDLEARIAEGALVPVPESSSLSVNADLPVNHRYCRPWTARFLADLAQAHEAAFHRPIEVSSAVRTVEYQMRLMETNGNAAPAEGDIVSPHMTGAAVDIAKKGMSRDEIAWMRRRLLALEDAGKIDVEEEFRQACFHITVYRNYSPSRSFRPPVKAVSPSHRAEPQPDPSDASTQATAGGV